MEQPDRLIHFMIARFIRDESL